MIRVDFLLGNFRFGPVETAGVIRASGLTVSATDAPVVIDDYNAIIFFPGGLDRTNVHTRWVFALLALHRHVKLVRMRNRVIVMGVSVLDVHRTLLHFKHADITVTSYAIMVVLMVAGFGATPATNAHAEVQRISEFNAFLRSVVADRDIRSIILFGVLLQMFEHGGKLLFVEFTVMLLKEIIDREIVPAPRGEWCERFCKSGRAKRDGRSLEQIAACRATAIDGLLMASAAATASAVSRLVFHGGVKKSQWEGLPCVGRTASPITGLGGKTGMTWGYAG